MLRVLLLFVCMLLLPLIHTVHQYIEVNIPKAQESEAHFYLLPPELLQVTALGHDNLLADILWLQVIQYYGGHVTDHKPMPHLSSFFNAITTLDPDFEEAYVFASFLLADMESKYAAVNILKKGLPANPYSWVIPYQLGFMYYLYFKNNERAASYFELAASKKEASPFLARLAAYLYAKVENIDECQISPRLWSDAYQRAVDLNVKKTAQEHLVELKMKCDRDMLVRAIQAYKKWKETEWKKLEKKEQEKRHPILYPASLNELVSQRLLPSIPQDPFGRSYAYDSETGKVKISPPPWKKLRELKKEDLLW